MRKTIINFGNVIWTVVKSPMGLTLLGGATGSLVTHMLGNTHRERELHQTKDKLKQAENRIKTLYERNELIRDRDQALLIALREADKYGNRMRSDFEHCHSQKELLQYAFNNSCCFYRAAIKLNHENNREKPAETMEVQP